MKHLFLIIAAMYLWSPYQGLSKDRLAVIVIKYQNP